MRKCDLKTVIAPSRQARLSDLQIRNVIKGLIGRSLDVFLRKRGMTIGLIFFYMHEYDQYRKGGVCAVSGLCISRIYGDEL